MGAVRPGQAPTREPECPSAGSTAPPATGGPPEKGATPPRVSPSRRRVVTHLLRAFRSFSLGAFGIRLYRVRTRRERDSDPPHPCPSQVVIGRHAGPAERASEPRQDGLRWLLGPAHRSELLRRPERAPGGARGRLPARQAPGASTDRRPAWNRSRWPGHLLRQAGTRSTLHVSRSGPPREAGLGAPRNKFVSVRRSS